MEIKDKHGKKCIQFVRFQPAHALLRVLYMNMYEYVCMYICPAFETVYNSSKKFYRKQTMF